MNQIKIKFKIQIQIQIQIKIKTNLEEINEGKTKLNNIILNEALKTIES